MKAASSLRPIITTFPSEMLNEQNQRFNPIRHFAVRLYSHDRTDGTFRAPWRLCQRLKADYCERWSNENPLLRSCFGGAGRVLSPRHSFNLLNHARFASSSVPLGKVHASPFAVERRLWYRCRASRRFDFLLALQRPWRHHACDSVSYHSLQATDSCHRHASALRSGDSQAWGRYFGCGR
jgi:hypothetical protein